MAFALYLRHSNFQPEEPRIYDKETSDEAVQFTFVDFVPSVIKRSGTVIPTCQVEYHSFGNMVELANGWLQKHGSVWEVVNLETIMLLYKYNETAAGHYEIRPNDSCFYISGSEKNNVLKALRMWIRRRPIPLSEQRSFQVIGFRDLLPEPKPMGKTADGASFEDLDDLIARFNESMQTTGLEGRVITIESLAYEADKDWHIDTDLSLSGMSTKNVFILRIFYQADEVGPLTHEQIDIRDFRPDLMQKASFFRRPRFERFDRVIERASDWLRKNSQTYRFINAQSIDIKMKSMTEVNSRQMAYTERGDYMRVFRLALVKLPPIKAGEDRKPMFLATRLFLPTNRTDMISTLKQRLSEWINSFLEKYRHNIRRSCPDLTTGFDQLTYPDILSAETVEVFAKDFPNENTRLIKKAANVDTFLANRLGNKNAYLFFSLRIFYDNGTMSSSTSTVLTSAETSTVCDEEEEEDDDDSSRSTPSDEDGNSVVVGTGTPKKT